MLCFLSTTKELETLMENEKDFIVYKFNSRGCKISDKTLRFVQEAQKEGNMQHIYFVDIINNREVSNSLVEITGIEHESPQAIVFSGGKAVKHTSHMHITKERILENSPFQGKK